METSTKKTLLGVSFVLLATGVAAYLYFKNKGQSDSVSEGGQEPSADKKPDAQSTTASPTKGIITDKPVVKNPAASKPATTTKPIKVATQKANIVGANRLLANDIHAADAKAIYSLYNETPFYSMQGAKVGVAGRAAYMGVASYAKASSGGNFVIYFLGKNNIKFYVSSQYIGIKTN